MCVDISLLLHETLKFFKVLEQQMGLQNQLSDVSTESIPVLVVVLIGKGVSYIHSLLLTLLRGLGLFCPPFDPDHHHHLENSLYDIVGSGLASLVVLCEQLNLNRVYSYQKQADGVDGSEADCVVCLNRIGEGDRVRRLACRHVFHKECFDGWLDHLNFNCPICRAPLLSDEHVDCTRRRVAGDLVTWFQLQ